MQPSNFVPAIDEGTVTYKSEHKFDILAYQKYKFTYNYNMLI